VTAASSLPLSHIAAVRRLLDTATEADGVRPVSEQAQLHLQHGADRGSATHLLAHLVDGTLVGYAHLDVTDQREGPVAELVVHPAHRRRGYAKALVEAIGKQVTDQRLRLWAHGDREGATAFARSAGYVRQRVLLQMRRTLMAELPTPVVPNGVRVETFRPGTDDVAWVRINARAFADHPEQGRLTLDDLHQRMAEPWFDPAGFFLAWADRGALVGFHWTKVHADTAHEQEPAGEIYVLGVDPDAQGKGLGKALALIGLQHLRGLGLTQVLLYVDESNAAAVGTYTRLGFVRWEADVVYERPAAPGAAI
jgi:mycothiol synthase